MPISTPPALASLRSQLPLAAVALTFAGTVAASGGTGDAKTFTADPVVFVDGAGDGSVGLGRLSAADLDRDGRLDLVCTVPGQPVRMLSSPAERLHRTSVTGAAAVLDSAVQPLEAGAALLAVDAAGLHRWQFDSVKFVHELAIPGDYAAVREQPLAGLPLDLVFLLSADRLAIDVWIGSLVDGSWIGPYPILAENKVQAIETFDMDGDGRVELAATDKLGCTIYTVDGIELAYYERPAETLAEFDQLARLSDQGSPVEELAWVAQDENGLHSLAVIGLGQEPTHLPLAGAGVGQVGAADLDGDGRDDLALPAGSGGFRVLTSGDGVLRFEPGSLKDSFAAAHDGPTVKGGPGAGLVAGDFDRDGDVDLIGSQGDEVYLARSATIDDRNLAVTLDEVFSVAVTDTGEVDTQVTFLLEVEQPALLDGGKDLHYRVWHRPEVVQPVGHAAESVASGKLTSVEFPALLSFDVAHAHGEAGVWYLELELVSEETGLLPSAAFVLAPSELATVAWESEPGAPLWGLTSGGAPKSTGVGPLASVGRADQVALPSGGGTSQGEGTVGTAGIGDSPRIPPQL